MKGGVVMYFLGQVACYVFIGVIIAALLDL